VALRYAQLIGGEVSLLPAEAHAEALAVMRRYGRMPMSFSHGDFDYEYRSSSGACATRGQPPTPTPPNANSNRSPAA